MPSRHSAIVGGSNAARVLNCPGSHRLIQSLPEDVEAVSSYANEGSALHELVADLIAGKLKMTDIVPGQTIMTVPGGDPVRLTRELWSDCVLPILKYWDYLKLNSDRAPLVEAEWPFPGIEGAFGTCDLVTRSAKKNATFITDWKFGAGVGVAAIRPDPDDLSFVFVNEQLLYYACCAQAAKPDWFPPGVRIVLSIVQPRHPNPDHVVSTATVTLDELKDFQEDLVRAVRVALHNDEPPIRDGSWCRFAPCRVVCPIHTGPLFTLADFAEDPPAPEAPTYLHMLAGILEQAERVENLIAEARRQAHDRLARGEPLPGWKLVAKRGNRRWMVEELALKLELRRRYRIRANDVYTRALKTPAQIEKMIGPKTRLPEALAAAPMAGTTLARMNDKRPAVTGADVGEIVRDLIAEPSTTA